MTNQAYEDKAWQAEQARLEQGLPFIRSGWDAEQAGEIVEALPRCDRYSEGCWGDPAVGILLIADPSYEGGVSPKPEEHWWVCSNGHTWRRAEPAEPDYLENMVSDLRTDDNGDVFLALEDARDALYPEPEPELSGDKALVKSERGTLHRDTYWRNRTRRG